MKEGSLFHCLPFQFFLTCHRFMALTICFYITNPTTYLREEGLPRYDKLRQIRWLIDRILENCKRVWKLDKICTNDEMMICYKGIYCPLWQYMPQKPQKWGIKIWYIACSMTKFK